MGQDRHAAKYQKNDFCARVPCGHNDYIGICRPPWSAVMFAQRKRGGAGYKKYEAHHILCWSCVSGSFFAANEKCEAILKGTKWCVNNGTNMIALPLWGHTVIWYIMTDTPPGFMNLPNHDRDHPDFTTEVKKSLSILMKQVQVKKGEHEAPDPVDIAEDLNSLSGTFEGKLRSRGIRSGGTHEAFKGAVANTEPEWFRPFSMSSDPEPRNFPSSFANKRDAIREAQKLITGGS